MGAYIEKAAINGQIIAIAQPIFLLKRAICIIIGACCRVENWRFNSNFNPSKLLKLVKN